MFKLSFHSLIDPLGAQENQTNYRFLEVLSSVTTSIFAISLFLMCCAMASCSKVPDKSGDLRPVRAVPVTSGQQQLSVEYSGNLQARVESNLGFRVPGKIQTRWVDVGARVKPGQILMQLDVQDLKLAQGQAQANYRAALSNYETNSADLKRFQELRKSNAVSQSALEAKTSMFEAAKATFEQADAALKTQTNQTTYASLVSDVEGVVTAINAEAGQVVAAGMPVIKVAKISSVPAAGEFEVVVGIPENALEIVNKVNQVNVKLWANSKEIMLGKVRELSPVADSATRTFQAKVSLINLTPKQISLAKLGMTASVQFSLSTTKSFVKIPMSALFNDKGVTSVWIVEQGKVKTVPVQIGGVSGNEILLTDGLNAGQTLVIAGVHILTPGQAVSILPPETKVVPNEPFISSQSLLAAPAFAVPPASANTNAATLGSKTGGVK